MSALIAEVSAAGSIAAAQVRRGRTAQDERAGIERAAALFRATDCAEQARTALQRRGWMVCRAEVVGGEAGFWKVSGQREFLDDGALIEFARQRCGKLLAGSAPPAPIKSTPAAADAAPAENGPSGESEMDTANDVTMTGRARLERAGLSQAAVRELLVSIRDSFADAPGGCWPAFAAAAGLNKTTLYNASGGHANIGHTVIEAFYDEPEPGRLLLKAQWLDRLDPPEAAADAVADAAPAKPPVAPLNGTPVTLERALAEVAAWEPLAEAGAGIQGFVTVQPDPQQPAAPTVAEGAVVPPASVSAEKGAGASDAATVYGPADGAGGVPLVTPPAQPEPPATLPAPPHWRWMLAAAIDAKLTTLLVEETALQDAHDECLAKIEALRVLRDIGGDLPEPDAAAVAALVQCNAKIGRTEFQAVAA